MRSDSLIVALGVAACLSASCSDPKSFIVLNLQTPASASASIPGVTSVEVAVSKGNTVLASLTYPVPGTAITIDKVTINNLSVNFDGDATGNVTFDVDVVSGNCIVGRGQTIAEIRKGAIANATVFLSPILECRGDGGTDGSPSDGLLPGCDPANPTSTTAGVTCSATQTCQVNCSPTPPGTPPRNECTMAGAGEPGAACPNMNRDCKPGTQCFNYGTPSTPMCNVQVCLQFCNTNADCAAFGAGGAGPGSFCEGPVQCGTTPLAYHTCTFNCDPRAAAAANRGGCPMGLACVASDINDQVDCTCTAYRTRVEGQQCTTSSDCAAGLLCNLMGGAATCRAICRCDKSAANPSACAAANDCTGGRTCTPVTNNMIYGVCL
jgi:hypothetical protein